MARKGKDKGTLQLDKLGDVLEGMKRALKSEEPAPVRPPDMSPEARRERLLGLGMTAEEIDRQFAVTARTTLCDAHVPNADATACGRCGKPLGDIVLSGDLVVPIDEHDEWKDISDAARASEARLPSDDGMRASDHPLIKPLIDETLGKRPGSGFDVILVGIKPIWHQRAKTMAEVDGFDVPDFIERLIKRQWIASGGGKR